MTQSTGEAYENAHAVQKGDPRHDGPYLDDINAARENAYRETRGERMRLTDEALKDYDGLGALDRQRRIDAAYAEAEELERSHDARNEAEENAKVEQVPLAVAQDPKLLNDYNSSSNETNDNEPLDEYDAPAAQAPEEGEETPTTENPTAEDKSIGENETDPTVASDSFVTEHQTAGPVDEEQREEENENLSDGEAWLAEHEETGEKTTNDSDAAVDSNVPEKNQEVANNDGSNGNQQ